MSHNALAVDLKVIEAKLLTMRERAEAIVVNDHSSYAAACEIVLAGRSEVKTIKRVLEPGIAYARENMQKLQRDMAAFIDRVTPIIAIAEQKGEAWVTEEKRKTAAEQERKNQEARIEAQRKADEERREAEKQAKIDRERRERELEQARKAGEINKREAEKAKKQAQADEAAARELAAKQAAETAANVKTVTVAPAIPKVSGIRRTTSWKWRMKDIAIVPREFLYPNPSADGTYNTERFPRIGDMVREEKDKDKAEALCPGIEVYSQDGI